MQSQEGGSVFNVKLSGISAVAAFVLSLLIGLVSRSSMPVLIIRPLIFAPVFFILAGVVSYLVNHFLPELFSGSGDNDATAINLNAGMDSAGADPAIGSRINITEGDSPFMPSYASSAHAAGNPSAGAQPDDSEENLGTISDLFAKKDNPEQTDSSGMGMDQNAQDHYNSGEGAKEESPPADQFVPWEQFAPREPDSAASVMTDAAQAGSAAASPKTGTGASKAAAISGASLAADFFPDLDAMAGAFAQTEGGTSDEQPGFTAAPKPLRKNKAQSWSEDFNAKEMAMGLRTALNKEKEG